jgi:hypothetical protein
MPTIRTKNSDGSHEIRVIDPAYTRRPVPLETWRSQQNFTEGIILTGDIDSEKPNLYMHSELLTDRQYERLCGIISDVTGSELLPDKKALGEYIQNLTIDAYAAIMDTFFNLQHEEEEVPINMQWGLYDSWEYSLSLAKKVRSGRGHLPSLPDLYDESGVHKTIGSLAKLFLYEMWLTATDPYANA